MIFGKTIEVLHKKQEQWERVCHYVHSNINRFKRWEKEHHNTIVCTEQRAAQFNITKPEQLTDVQHKLLKLPSLQTFWMKERDVSSVSDDDDDDTHYL